MDDEIFCSRCSAASFSLKQFVIIRIMIFVGISVYRISLKTFSWLIFYLKGHFFIPCLVKKLCKYGMILSCLTNFLYTWAMFRYSKFENFDCVSTSFCIETNCEILTTAAKKERQFYLHASSLQVVNQM